ncbi:hypothetical protein CANTEDRAFT_100334 [Yamadazyma tenuis ATCC 10573]|uniref:Sister chromatid cohesion protein DCC1 n=1 Tax=Candida tenuis (strain ATCC 10573 / BCRC 21748 / CBS 615 / JCM 9827 / NBRC 10315 / NRRL Y-1498 / VKM Y-70) TaxID=590646 RepID=G3AWN7_CANTC|nr:uncharacterized protein CANTEDRAFT_100334 [Yamadazyma tenuis ATCC 10573]EGV66579.1 hypothetical protein CANTEDRAFT_100334 [Yamadazyma tenuis ATCC 10573]
MTVKSTYTPQSFELYQQLQPQTAYTYKLIQLPPELLSCIEAKSPLNIKSSRLKNDLTLVSQDKTWKLRQMDQTDTVLLMDCNVVPGSLVGLTNLPYEYELVSTKILIDVSKIPVYKGESSLSTMSTDIVTCSLSKLIDDTPISTEEFYKEWYEVGGCEINGCCFVIDDSLVTKFLHTFLTVVISSKIDYKSGILDLEKFSALLEPHGFIAEVSNTLFHKFCRLNSDHKYTIHNDKIAKWFGIQTLKSARSFDIDDFNLQWKNQFPNFYNVPLDVKMLRGHLYKTAGSSRISYLSESSLSSDIVQRIRELFKLASEWEIDDIAPYVQKFMINKKLETGLLKYAKVRKVGKSKIVCPR